MKPSRIKSPIGRAYGQRQLEEGAPSSGRRNQALGADPGEGSAGWTSAPARPLSQGLRGHTEHVI